MIRQEIIVNNELVMLTIHNKLSRLLNICALKRHSGNLSVCRTPLYLNYKSCEMDGWMDGWMDR